MLVLLVLLGKKDFLVAFWWSWGRTSRDDRVASSLTGWVRRRRRALACLQLWAVDLGHASVVRSYLQEPGLVSLRAWSQSLAVFLFLV